MSSHLARLHAAAEAATAARAAAEHALGCLMDDHSVRTGPADLPDCVHARDLEARIELDPNGLLARAYSAYRRTQRQEDRARRAIALPHLHAATAPAARRKPRHAKPKPAAPPPAPRPKKPVFWTGLDPKARQVWESLREMRGAA